MPKLGKSMSFEKIYSGSIAPTPVRRLAFFLGVVKPHTIFTLGGFTLSWMVFRPIL